MSDGYAYDHAWADERVRLAGLETALDPGTREHFLRLGLAPGSRCLDVGGGGGSVAFWLAEQVVPGGSVLVTDLETDFLESEADRHSGLEVLQHDVTIEDLPGDFDFVHARWLVEWLPDKRLALQRMVNALKSGGTLLVEEPDFVSIFGTAEPPALRRTMTAAMAYLESTCSVEVTYGRRLLDVSSPLGSVTLEQRGARQWSMAAALRLRTSFVSPSKSFGDRCLIREMCPSKSSPRPSRPCETPGEPS